MATDHIVAGDRVLLPGFGPCCACEGDIKHQPILIMLDVEAPQGFAGWGCLVCKLPPRGAIAVMCQGCIRAERLPRHMAAGNNLADNRRVPIVHSEVVPFRHDTQLHYLAATALSAGRSRQ